MSESLPVQPAIGDGAPQRGDERMPDRGRDGAANLARSRAEIERARRALTRGQLEADRAVTVVASSEEPTGPTGRIVANEAIALGAGLRANVVAYVRELQHEGLPPEQMLVRIKTALREILPRELDAAASRDLMSDVVRWSIDAYYAERPPGASTS